ncbi:tellurite resistance TerB family protein [Kiloniella laminariae]|uniref:Tellurite resistance TerB family protein n=1 Tax=Kiloniella laminariae TaxID=454162 RepID=A0ABT4LM86_9PROT|nr:tellurite resistance TerB family protein [Kiloniella laminariae]MCZ4282221.1 tellurite resistance TerB family protein [Kiloniella laminariae]
MTDYRTALVYIMVLASAADSDMTDSELQTIGEIVKFLPVFKGYNPDDLPKDANACAELLGGEDGFEEVISQAAKALPEKLHETAYALALEVVAADGFASQEELRLLEILRHTLNVERLVAAAIERGTRARYTSV